MPSQRDRARNNVRAGVFVTLTLTAALLIVIVLSGKIQEWSRRSERYTVRYPVASGVSNLAPGAQVRVGGLDMGRVVAVRAVLEDPVREIDVDFELDARVPLHDGAEIAVMSPLLGPDARLEVTNVGDPDKPLPKDKPIAGITSSGMLSSLLGPESSAAADRFIQFLGSTEDEVRPILENVRAVTDDARTVSGDIRDRWQQKWAEDVDDVLTWANGFTARLNGAVDEGRAAFEEAHGILADNREPVKAAVADARATAANSRELTERLKGPTADKLDALLDTGDQALEAARSAVETIERNFEDWSVTLGETLGNTLHTSQQLKLASAELRQNPWKLLYRPSDREYEHQLLYDAARSFAVAAVDLNAAAASLNGLLEKHGDEIKANPALGDRVTRNLVDSLENYDRAQKRLYDVLFSGSP